jgi:D-alanyl-D-alanine carboxypeptidase
MKKSILTSKKSVVIFGFLGIIAMASIILWSVYADHTSPPRFTPDDLKGQRLQQKINRIAKATVEGGAPGVSILVRQNGIEFVASSGIANKATNELMPTDDTLRIASIAKVYTATIILKMAEQQLLSLDDLIGQHLPEFITDGLPNAESATLRHLLNHTSGIPDYYDWRSYFFQDWTQALTLERALPVAKRHKSEFSVGERFSYSNMGYILLGEIAEKVSGKSYNALLEEYVSGPLELDNTFYNVQFPTNSRIHGYGTIMRPWADTYQYWEHSGPDGGIVASSSNVARFIEALTFDNQPLSEIGMQMMEVTVPSGRNEEQGLGLIGITSNSTGDKLLGHTGDVFGYQTIAFSLPQDKTVFVAQINCDCAQLTSSLIRNLYLGAVVSERNK